MEVELDEAKIQSLAEEENHHMKQILIIKMMKMN